MLSIGLNLQHHCIDGLLPLLVAAFRMPHGAHQTEFLFRMEPHRGTPAFQKPCTADSRSLWNNQLKAKLLRPFGQRSDLLPAIPGFVVFGSFIDVRLSVFDEPVEQAG